MEQAAARIKKLFSGLDRAYGVALPSDVKDGRGKVGARYVTRRDEPSEAEWMLHLKGEHCLVPIPIRDDEKVLFGAIDIDIYPLDLPGVVKKIEDLELPLVVCRSKSGGAHAFLFLRDPTDASLVQEKLMSWAMAIGYPGVEIFPKQIMLAGDADTGNGIAAPYKSAKHTTEYALGPDGRALSLDEFLSFAERRRRSADDLPDPPEVDYGFEMEGAPPCLQHWIKIGIGEGQRNDVMFDFAVYCKQKWPDDWREKVEEINRQFGDPPLSSQEILAIIKSVGGPKTYTYKSKCQGPYCQPQICQKRQFGRGSGNQDSGAIIDGLTILQTDPPLFIVGVNGQRVQMTNEEFVDQRRFRNKVTEKLYMRMRQITNKAWDDLIDKLLKSAEKEPVPEDAGKTGQVWINLNMFFEEHAEPDRSQIKFGHAWYDDDRKRIYFRSHDFLDYVKRKRLDGVAAGELFAMIRHRGGDHMVLKAKGVSTRVWWVPYEMEVEEEDDPEIPDTRPPGNEIPF